MQTTWGSTVKLGAVVSIAAAVIGVLLVSIGDLPQTGVVIGVMVVGFTASMVTSEMATRSDPEPARLPAIRSDRRAA